VKADENRKSEEKSMKANQYTEVSDIGLASGEAA